jgi:hypothetical protein
MPIRDRAFRGGSMLADEGRRHRPHGHRGLAPDQEAILDLQGRAGNTAVTRALRDQRAGVATSIDAIEINRTPMAPEKGVGQIRDLSSSRTTLAYTIRSLENQPPIMLPELAEKTKDGYTSKAVRVDSVPEPKIDEWWPTEGPHKLGKGEYLYVDHDWETRLEKGEDEHRDDAKLAWNLTWKKVQETINRFAAKPGPPQPTAEAAEQALWKRYVAALPKELRPAGDRWSVPKQLDVLALKPGTFTAWMWETTVARDTRLTHETVTGTAPDGVKGVPKGASVVGVKEHPSFKVPGLTSEALFDEVRPKFQPGKSVEGSKMKADGSPGMSKK